MHEGEVYLCKVMKMHEGGVWCNYVGDEGECSCVGNGKNK
jgi:hypothetical protein